MTLENFKLRTAADDGDRKLLSDVAEFGWHVLHVPADSEGPSFTFTVGLYYSFGHSEPFVMGLSQSTSHEILQCAVDEIKKGKSFIADEITDKLIIGRNCKLSSISPENYKPYLGYALWFYRSLSAPFPALQIIWPDEKGLFPGDIGYDASYYEFQTII